MPGPTTYDAFPPPIAATSARWLLQLAAQARLVDVTVLRATHQPTAIQPAAASHAAGLPPCTVRFMPTSGGRPTALGWQWLQRLVSIELLRGRLEAAADYAGGGGGGGSAGGSGLPEPPTLRERPPVGWGGATADAKLLASAARHGVGQMRPLQLDAQLQLGPDCWRSGAGAVHARQSQLMHALLSSGGAEETLRRRLASPPAPCTWLPVAVAPRPLDEPAATPRAPGLPHGLPLPTDERQHLLLRLHPVSSNAPGKPADLWVHRSTLTLRGLTELVRHKQAVPAASCAGLLKLPDVLLADEEDVQSLDDGAELVLLLKAPPGPVPH